MDPTPGCSRMGSSAGSTSQKNTSADADGPDGVMLTLRPRRTLRPEEAAKIVTKVAERSLDPIPQQPSCSTSKPSDLRGKEVFEPKKSMLENAKRTGDFVLYLRKDKEMVKVHKSVLLARSQVFESIFETVDLYMRKNEHFVDCVSLRGMNIALNYIYFEELPVKGTPEWTTWTKIPEEILYMAGKYQLDGLTTFCNENIYKVCKFENSVRLVTISEQFGMKLCSQAVQQFFKDYMDNVVRDE